MLPYQRRIPQRVRPRGQQNAYILAVMLVGGLVLVAQMFWVKQNQYRFMPFAIDRVKCEECGGTGLVSPEGPANTKLVMCPTCFGVGSHQFRRVDEYDSLCAACEGMGRVQDGDTWRTCRRCDGRGLVRAESAPAVSDFLYELQPSLYVTNESPAIAPAPDPDLSTRNTDH
jgi:hypothetical protein